MAKKTTDWDKVSKDRELLARAEALVKEGSSIKGELPQEICDELNALTGNGWKAAKYKEFCDTYFWPWEADEIVYALFHNGKYPDKKEEELHAWSIEESFESDQDAIAFFELCTYQHDAEKSSRYDQVDVRPLNKELLAAFEGWDIDDDWEANDYITFCCSNKENYGLTKALKIFNGYDQRMLHIRFFNFDEQEKETVTKLLKKYYNHISSDFDMNKAMKQNTATGLDDEDMAALMSLLSAYDAETGDAVASDAGANDAGTSDAPDEITREYLEKNWELSAYDEDTDEEIDYYINGNNVRPGDKAYMYVNEDGELRELEILHTVACSDDPDEYNRLLEEEDVLLRLIDEYGADTGAEFITDKDSYLICFKEIGSK
ncbi:MAG: hypothetical protein IKP95_06825 [Ruminococcus sp.]|nr:hypothetical protein [Ruminococcus sp.]